MNDLARQSDGEADAGTKRVPGRAWPQGDVCASLQLDRQLCFALYAASLAMTRLYKPRLDRLGLTYPQYLAMLVLWQGDGVSVSELGAHLVLDSGTLTPLLKRLQAAGWIRRTRNVRDERRVDIHLTPAGLALREQALIVPASIAQAAGSQPDDLAGLTKQLQALRQTLLAAASGPPAQDDVATDPPPGISDLSVGG
jgi:MarR family transcriptional regulator, organic hydroperoxide resistance regulator